LSTFLMLETDVVTKEKIEVLLDNNLTAGKCLFGLLSTLSCYCDTRIPQQQEVISWFLPLEKSIPNICNLADVWYEGDWNYTVDEYERFVSETSFENMTKESFEKIIIQIENKWKDIHEINKIVLGLISVLDSNPDKFQDTWFFDRINTIPELKALDKHMNICKSLGAKSIRFKFY